MYRELLNLLEKSGKPTIGVIGDLMLDRYLWGAAERVSPEAPVPVVDIERSKTYSTVGGAGSVMRDLVALGADVWAAGVIGKDPAGEEILAKLSADGIDTSLVYVDSSRSTTKKTRVLSRTQHLLRMDEDASRPLDAAEAVRLAESVASRLAGTDILILSDYIPERGILSAGFVSAVAEAASAAGVPVWADPARGRNFLDFKGVTAVTPNRKETAEATGLPIPPGSLPRDAAGWLIDNLGLEIALITLDVEGIYYLVDSGEEELVSAKARAAYDVTGAGDMMIAAAAFALASGFPLSHAVAFANFAAGIEVEKIGVQPVERREIVRRLKAEAHIAPEKVLDLDELLTLLENHRRRGESISFTNGCFDIIHPGHAMFLAFARAQGDLLVVGLNSDRSVRAIKGENRPVFTQNERAAVLAAFEAVDYVVIFDEDTPAALINAVRPDILVKGEDWREKGVVGRDTVEASGGKVVLAPLVPGLSTTGAVERILKAHLKGKSK